MLISRVHYAKLIQNKKQKYTINITQIHTYFVGDFKKYIKVKKIIDSSCSNMDMECTLFTCIY